MTEKAQIHESAREILREQHVPEVAIDAAECILEHVIEAAQGVAREFDPTAGDDLNLAGFMVARRGKNLAARALLSRDLPDLRVRPAAGFTWDINASGTRLHTYSAPSGVDAFQLVGGERKSEIIERSAEQLSLFEILGTTEQPGDLVLAYTRDTQGLRQAVLGVMQSETEFAWRVRVHDRGDHVSRDQERARDEDVPPGFRDQPAIVPGISLKRAQEKRERL